MRASACSQNSNNSITNGLNVSKLVAATTVAVKAKSKMQGFTAKMEDARFRCLTD